MKKLIFVLLLGCAVGTLQAQLRNSDVYKNPETYRGNVRHQIRIPDILGYKTLKCDFHIHTVFSDGLVWPTVRVDEAWRDGLDAIAITDHIEYRPRKEDLKGDLNRSYEIAANAGQRNGIIVIHGTEITRQKPFGHMNALFIQDANPMNTPDQMDALNEALKQKAFIEWNHPGWPNDSSTFYDMHKKLLKEGKINGIEIINGWEWYPCVADWCREYNVAYLGNSDIHNETSIGYGDGYRRPFNLIFATDRSEQGIRDALFAGRSVTVFNQHYFGPEKYLKALVEGGLRFHLITTDAKGNRRYDVENLSDMEFHFIEGNKNYGICPGETLSITLPAKDVEMAVDNFRMGENLPLKISLPFSVQ